MFISLYVYDHCMTHCRIVLLSDNRDLSGDADIENALNLSRSSHSYSNHRNAPPSYIDTVSNHYYDLYTTHRGCTLPHKSLIMLTHSWKDCFA